MPRRPKNRWVENLPRVNRFKPAGIPLADLEEITLSVDELEAIRLKDLEGLDQEDCAVRMRISRPTFHRILVSARSKVAEALVEGKALRIEGGDFKVYARRFKCISCGHEWEVPFGTGQRGIDMQCPECGSPNIHRMDQGGRGFGNQPWGRRGPGRHGGPPGNP